MFNSSEPLGLPRGSVRGIIALLLSVTFCATLLLGQELNQALLTVLSVVITFYFVKRGDETNGVPVEQPLPEPYVD